MSIATVLLVDDEPAFVETMEKRMKKRDFEVIPTFSGPDALDALARNPAIEVVVLDVKMPRMDGIETLAEIKKRHPLVQVIMLTAHGTIESAVEGMKMGAFDYLLKPSEIETLTEKVTKAAQRKREHDQKIVEARLQNITRRRA